jgi:hypothetical protein
MNGPHPAAEAWAEWWRRLDAFSASIKRVRGQLAGATAFREEAKEAVQFYFRHVRPQLVALPLAQEDIDVLDGINQHLLELAARPNRKSTYRSETRKVNGLRGRVETAIEIRANASTPSQAAAQLTTSTEAAILKTLDQLVPTTALSYKQVLLDLGDKQRTSFRGTASELREVLRELLDHLAPDDDLLKSGVKLEKDQKRPSMKQKAIFIMKSRGIGETGRKTSEHAVEAIENSVGQLARSVYDRGSLSTHVATTRQEVLTLKGYADAVLADLLQIHNS